MKKGATFSDCGKYRFVLWRIWDESLPQLMVIGLNPSTANADTDDPTIRRVIQVAANNGYGAIYMTNCFPIVSADPSVLINYDKSIYDQVQYQRNNSELLTVREKCESVVFAWGNFKVVSETGRDHELHKMFPQALAFHINKNGSPKHPLYCRADTKFVNYDKNNQ